MNNNEFKNVAISGKIDDSKELVSAGVSCGKNFCRPFDIIHSAAKEIKSLRA